MSKPVPDEAEIDRLMRRTYTELPADRFDTVLDSMLAALPPTAGHPAPTSRGSDTPSEVPAPGEVAKDPDRRTGTSTVSSLHDRRRSPGQRPLMWMAAAAAVLAVLGTVAMFRGRPAVDEVADPPRATSGAQADLTTTITAEPGPTPTVPVSSAPLDDSPIGRTSGVATPEEIQCANDAPSEKTAWTCFSQDTLAAMTRQELSDIGMPTGRIDCITDWIRSVPASESRGVIQSRNWDDASIPCWRPMKWWK